MDNGKLISCFPTFKDSCDLSFKLNLKLMPQNNMLVFKTLFYNPKEKQANCFE